MTSRRDALPSEPTRHAPVLRRIAGALALLSVAVLLAFGPRPAMAQSDSAKAGSAQGDQARLVERARLTLEQLTSDPEFDDLNRYLKNAEAVLIVPQLIKGGFIVGGEGGSAVLLARAQDGTWSPPAFYTLGAASIGLQIGGQVSQVVFTIMNRDALAQAADRLLNIEGVTTTLVYGLDDRTIYVSARTRGTDLDLGEALRDAFGQIGSAGGHADMAGAQIELGVMEDEETPIEEIAEGIVTDRFLDVLEARWNRPLGVTTGEQYLVESEDVDTSVVVSPPEGESLESLTDDSV